MSKKSPRKSLEFMERYYSPTTIKNFNSTVRRYEEFHKMSMDELVEEAIQEQRDRVPEDMLTIYDRLLNFRDYLAKDMLYNSVINNYNRITKVYKMNRVRIPYIPPLNIKQCNLPPTKEYEDVLTIDEIKLILQHMNPEMRIRAMAMTTGGFATQEADSLTREQFFKDTYQYHQCDDYWDAMKKLSKMDNVIWVTKLYRQKTKKPYYGLVNPETTQAIALQRMNDEDDEGKLFDCYIKSFSKRCTLLNKRLGLGFVGKRGRLTTHSFRVFYGTHIRGAALSYEEQLKVSEVDELQGRGKTKTQDAYMKVSKMHQKLLYAKAMNNVSIYNKYDYKIVDDDVVITRIDTEKKMRKLISENQELRLNVKYSNDISPELENVIKDVGKDNFISQVSKLVNSL